MKLALYGFIVLLALVFIGINIWAFAATPFQGLGDVIRVPMEALSTVIPSHRWTTVIAADLFLGWCMSSILIAFNERNWLMAVAWIVMLFWFGNIVLAIYLLFRLGIIRARLRRPAANPRSLLRSEIDA